MVIIKQSESTVKSFFSFLRCFLLSDIIREVAFCSGMEWINNMAFDGITIANIVKELNDTIVGGKINKIAQPEADELLLTIKNNRTQYRLLISASASLPLIYFTEKNKRWEIIMVNKRNIIFKWQRKRATNRKLYKSMLCQYIFKRSWPICKTWIKTKILF